MNSMRPQYLVFTGLGGFVLDPEASAFREAIPALNLMRSLGVPLILTTDKTSKEAFRILTAINQSNPFIVESGAAIYIPEDALQVSYNYNNTVKGYRVVELGTGRETIVKMILRLREKNGFSVTGISELASTDAVKKGKIAADWVTSAQSREYSELVEFSGSPKDLQQFKGAIEGMQSRLYQSGDHYVITGDHDKGSAVRFLVQLYREEFSNRQIVTIGVGFNRSDTSLLHAVDHAVLIRRADGGFDEHVGRRGLRFTRNPGPIGWNEAVITLLTGSDET